MRYPKDNWKQRGDTDIQGLWSSFNLDLANKNKKGKLLVSPRTLLNYSSDSDALLGLPVAFKYFNTVAWYAVCGTRIFANGSAGSNTTRTPFTTFFLAAEAGASSITTCDINSDLEIFPDNDDLYVTTNSTNTYKFNGASWATVTSAGGTGGSVKKLLYFRPRKRMYMSYGGSKIISWNSADSVAALGAQYTLDIGASSYNFITTLVASPDYIWILTLNTAGNTSHQYFWDGSDLTSPTGHVVLESNGALAGLLKNNSLWIVDTEGRLLQNNGGSFIEKARFPFGGKIPKGSLLDSPVNAIPRWIHHNGMTLVDGKINILINNPFQDGTAESERCPAGVWEYDEDIGLYHKQSVSYSPKATGAITDYGQVRLSSVGALMSALHTSTNNGDLLLGASYFSDATTVKHGIFTNDSLDTYQKYGSFVTEWFTTENVKQNWQSIYARIRRHLTSTDKITVKYRSSEDISFQLTGTWTSTTTFTTPTDLRNYIGYEVEVLNGTGSGKTAHIVSVTEGTNWIVVLDETFTGVTTGTMKARVQSWLKSSQFSNQYEDAPEFSLPKSSNAVRVQLKICLEWTGKNEMFDIILDNTKAK